MRSPAAACIVLLGGLARAAAQDRPPLYYQDPDGRPFYASVPTRTADGRDYQPVFVDGAAAPKAKPAGDGRRILYYRNPMGLADTSPKPKKDPMGMDYVPVYQDDAGQGDPPGMVRIGAGRLQTLGVRTAAVALRPAMRRAIQATGVLAFDERHLAVVTTKVPGWIERLEVAATGDAVKRGQIVAALYSPDLVASEQEYLIAAAMGGAMRTSSVQRLHALDISDDEIARLSRTGRPARRIDIAAREDGIVIDKPVQEGMRVDAGETLYRTADLADLWLIAQVQEQDLGTLRTGQTAHATFVAFPGRVFAGTVDFIAPSLSPETRTARVRIVLPNPDGALRAAMVASVQIDASASNAAPVLSVPNAAVLDNGARQVVLVARGEGRFEPRSVRLGLRGDDWVQVLDGVSAGDQVVVGANFLIDAESNLRAALQGFSAPSEPPGNPQ